MRLAQLARKLAIRPSEIVSFLATHNIVLDEKSNTRLDEHQTSLILKEFEPTTTIAPIEVVEEKVEIAEVEQETVQAPPIIEVEETKVEVIKAQRVELSGLKVIGKIDLPEPKKKADLTLETPVAESLNEPDRKEIRAVAPRRSRPDQRPVRKNPIALQREREASELEQKKEAKAQEQKEQRTKNYQNRVKVAAPTKRVKMIEEPIEVLSEENRVPPKTILGRFFRWLKS